MKKKMVGGVGGHPPSPSHLNQPEIFLPCHPHRLHIIQDNRNRYLVIPGDHHRPFCRRMMKDHVIAALADKRAPGSLKYPYLRFPVRRGYLFQSVSLKNA